MKATLGPDWHSVFDIIIANTKKPLFYNTENSFHPYDSKEYKPSSLNVSTVENLKKLCNSGSKFFTEGNMKIISSFF